MHSDLTNVNIRHAMPCEAQKAKDIPARARDDLAEEREEPGRV